jgi:hypothetical protein
MMRYDKRLDSLEARLLAMKTPAWPVRLAAQRAFADAVRAKLAQRLTGEPDTPAQVEQYTAARAQWQAVRGESGEDAGARARIAARLEEMAVRLQAYEARDGWSPA